MKEPGYKAAAAPTTFVPVVCPRAAHNHHDHACCAAPAVAAPAAPPPQDTTSTRYRIVNMDCPVEERLIRNRLGPMEGIARLDFDLMSRILTVHRTTPETSDLAQALAAIGMQGELLGVDAASDAPVTDQPHLSFTQKALLAVSGVAAVAAEVLAWTTHTDASLLVVLLVALSIATGGLPTLRKGWIALRNLTLNINFLMSLAVIGAVAIGQWPEAAMVVFLFAVGELIEGLSLDRARNASWQTLSARR